MSTEMSLTYLSFSNHREYLCFTNHKLDNASIGYSNVRMGLWKLRSKHIERKKRGRKNGPTMSMLVIESQKSMEQGNMIHWNNGLQRISTSLKSFFLLNLFPNSQGSHTNNPPCQIKRIKQLAKCSTLGGSISSRDHLGRWFPKYHLLNWVGLFPPIPPNDNISLQEKCECFWFKFHVRFQSSSNKERNLMQNQTYFPHQSHVPTFIHPFIHSCVYTHTHPLSFCLLALMLLHTLPLKLLSSF